MPMFPVFKEGREILQLSDCSFGQHYHGLDSVDGARQGGSHPQAMVLLGESQKGASYVLRTAALRFQVCPVSTGVRCSSDKEY